VIYPLVVSLRLLWIRILSSGRLALHHLNLAREAQIYIVHSWKRANNPDRPIRSWATGHKTFNWPISIVGWHLYFDDIALTPCPVIWSLCCQPSAECSQAYVIVVGMKFIIETHHSLRRV